MHKGITFLTSFLIIGGTVGYADEPRQASSEGSSSRSKAFEIFRSGAMQRFNDFREKVLKQYADFLNGEWHEFESIMEEDSPYTEPKPDTIPEYFAVAEELETNAMVDLPYAETDSKALPDMYSGVRWEVRQKSGLAERRKKAESKRMKRSNKSNDAKGKSNFEIAALNIPDPGFVFGSLPGQTEAPLPGVVNPTDSARATLTDGKEFHFDYYGMDMFIPEVDFTITESIQDPHETGANWKNMAAQDGGKETARQLFGLAQELGLNGYLTFRLAEAYAKQRFPQSDDKARMAAVHFLLVNMGYDVRLTVLGDTFTVMMPFDQKIVYGLLPMNIDDRKYYAMFPEGYEKPKAGTPIRLSTCLIPPEALGDVPLGKTSDLRLTGLNLPMKPKEFEVSRNGLTIKGVVNENLKELLYHYPQMPVGDFASSWVDQDLRDNVVAQLKSQMEGMTETQAINTLMSLCHYGFEYSTDQNFHGFEKPYFFEENFLHEKNDCEDRAIFFSYLIWNTLGLPCQLIQYPGHESVTVAAKSNITGCYYDTAGTKYFSSDPTYRGSRIGQVMTAYKTTAPSIDKQYGQLDNGNPQPTTEK